MSTVNKNRSTARRAILEKSASLTTDWLATVPTSLLGRTQLGILTGPAVLAGHVGGLVSTPKSDKNPETDGLSVVPGVGAFRMAQRQRRVMDASNAAGQHGTANVVAEQLGGLSSGLIGAGLGAAVGGGIGAAVNRSRIPFGAGVGAAAGAALPSVIGLLAAAVRRKRSKQEQIASDTTGRAVAKYFVPGLAAYDSAKRLGTSTHYDATAPKKGKEKKAAEFLAKRAQLDSARIAGTLAMLGGGALGGSAATGDDQSALKRIGKGTLGTGLAVAGYKAMTDPKWQHAIRKGVSTAGDYLSRLVGGIGAAKAAESAYAAGFRKAAEAAGVDPVALYKSAAPWGLLGKGINAIARFSQSSPKGQMAKGIQRGMNWFAGTRPGKAVARYGSLINGGGIAGYEAQLSRFGNQMRRAHHAGNFQRWGRAMADYNQTAGLLANERNAVNLARNATLLGGGTAAGVAGGYGLGRMTGGSDDDSQDSGWAGHNFSGYGVT